VLRPSENRRDVEISPTVFQPLGFALAGRSTLFQFDRTKCDLSHMRSGRLMAQVATCRQ
jgi:hypothetical protein